MGSANLMGKKFEACLNEVHTYKEGGRAREGGISLCFSCWWVSKVEIGLWAFSTSGAKRQKLGFQLRKLDGGTPQPIGCYPSPAAHPKELMYS